MKKKFNPLLIIGFILAISTNSNAENVSSGLQQNVTNNQTSQNTQSATLNAQQTASLQQETDAAKTRTAAESERLRQERQKQADQAVLSSGGRSDSTMQNVNQITTDKTNQYHGNVNDYNENGSAYDQAQSGQQKADSGKEIGMAVGGAMVVGGGALIYAGIPVEGFWPTAPAGQAMIIAGSILVVMGGMELAQSAIDSGASDQAKRSQNALKPVSLTDPIIGTYDSNGNKKDTYTDPGSNTNNNGTGRTDTKTNNIAASGNGTNGTDTGAGGSSSIIQGPGQAETKMANELAKYGITFDKDTKKVTLANGQSFTLDDVKKGEMPTADLQAGYNKAAASAQDIASREIASLGGNNGGSSSLGGARGLASDKSSMAGVAAALKDGAAGNGSGNLAGVAAGPDSNSAEVAGGNKAGGKKALDAAALANAKLLAGKVAGLSTNYNGEPIGVSSDSIFEMVKRRYEMKEKENTFITDLLTVTTN
jgi:hypothetical protein